MYIYMRTAYCKIADPTTSWAYVCLCNRMLFWIWWDRIGRRTNDWCFGVCPELGD